MIQLHDSLEKIKLVGPTYAKKLRTLGLSTVEDLLFYFPFRYENFHTDVNTRSLQPNTSVTLEARLVSIENIFTRNGKKLTKALFQDDKGLLPVTWFNQPYLTKSLKPGSLYKLSGKVQEFGHMLTLVAPRWERSTGTDLPVRATEVNDPVRSQTTGQLVPIYNETFGITSRWLRDKVKYVLENLEHFPVEYLPSFVLDRNKLMSLKKAIQTMHFPESFDQQSLAQKRFAYEELLFSQIQARRKRVAWKSQALEYSLPISKFTKEIESCISQLPFPLTEAQQRVIGEILVDLERSVPMNRLVEGDVGSGKTVVAAVAMYATYLCGYKSVLMAPTQILAAQHYKTVSTVLGSLGVKVGLVSGGTKRKKEDAQEYDIYIGTHALLFMKEKITPMGLTIIDEQHRFGVEQRSKLRTMHGLTHIVSMTATPIPRTLALTMYGDLDLSVIDQMPPGRKPVKTWVVPMEKRESSYDWMQKFIDETGEQVFIVCPFIQPSESDETVKAATAEFERLQKEVFTKHTVGILHGGMKADEKDEILLAFRDKKMEVLVCTPVVEVGIDIPNASIIVIESADRFGLAQLHQFRGRVGRKGQQAFCLLFASDTKNETSKRLKALESTYSGIELAEIDLKYRGAGNIFGTEQHGRQIFKYADFFDTVAISQARNDAATILDEDPELIEYFLLKERLQYVDRQVEAN